MDDNSNPKVAPQPQIQQSPQQSLPQQPSMGAPYQMPPKKKMRKGVLWGIIGVSGVLVISAIGVVLSMTIFGNPSKGDYKDVLVLISRIDIPDFSNISRGALKSNDYEGAINKNISLADEFYAKIGSHKALKDKEVKDAYDKYLKTWNDEGKPHIKDRMILEGEGIDKKCNDPDVREYFEKSKDEVEKHFDSVMKGCIDSLNKLSKSDSAKVRQYSEDLKKYYEDMRRYYAQVGTFRRDYLQKYGREPSLPSMASLRPYFGNYELAKKLEDSFSNFKRILEEKAK